MEKLEGKKVAIFYSDFEKVSRKDGVVTSESLDGYTLDKKIVIPKSRVVRIEVVSDDNP